MSEEMIRCVHPNGKPCLLTKKATEDANFMKKYGIRVEHVAKKEPIQSISITVDATEVKQVLEDGIKELKALQANPEAEAEAVDKQVAEALAEATKPAKPKATRTRKSKKPTKK